MRKPAPSKAPDPAPGQRIAKLLARAGIASRREIERMITEGRVALNGTVLDTPATILPSLHGVTVDGQAVRAAAPARLFRYHKPAGLLTTERDPAGRLTIYDRLPKELPRLMPVGRLDLNTEGLLLLTTDGELKRQLELPSTGVERIYRARTFGSVSQEQLEGLFDGIEIEGIRYGPIDANLERRTGRNQWIELKLTEGKNREVRRVLEHLGLQVSRLIRTAYGPFPLADLAPGAVEEVRQHDLVEFRRGLQSGAPAARAAKDEGTLPTPPPSRAQARLAPARKTLDRPRPAARSAPLRREVAAPAAAPRPQPEARARDERPRRPGRPPRSAADRDSLHHRPPRDPKPAPARAGSTAGKAAPPPDDKPTHRKKAGWAKAKAPRTPPKSSSRPTPRGGPAKRAPTRGRPGGTKQ